MSKTEIKTQLSNIGFEESAFEQFEDDCSKYSDYLFGHMQFDANSHNLNVYLPQHDIVRKKNRRYRFVELSNDRLMVHVWGWSN